MPFGHGERSAVKTGSVPLLCHSEWHNRLVARPARRGTTPHGTSAGNGDRGTAGPARDPRAREGRARAGADETVVDGVEVVHAPGEGDDTIVAIAEAHREVIVVTADRELADRVRAANAEVVGPSWLLDQLVE